MWVRQRGLRVPHRTEGSMSNLIDLPVKKMEINGVNVYPGDTVNIRRPGQKYLRCTIVHIGEKKVIVRQNERVKRKDGTYGIKLGPARKMLKAGLLVTAIRPKQSSRVVQDPEALAAHQKTRKEKGLDNG